jgi:hypothetical protein
MIFIISYLFILSILFIIGAIVVLANSSKSQKLEKKMIKIEKDVKEMKQSEKRHSDLNIAYLDVIMKELKIDWENINEKVSDNIVAFKHKG